MPRSKKKNRELLNVLRKEKPGRKPSRKTALTGHYGPMIKDILDEHHHSIRQVAKRLDISEDMLARQLKKDDVSLNLVKQINTIVSENILYRLDPSLHAEREQLRETAQREQTRREEAEEDIKLLKNKIDTMNEMLDKLKLR